jgi:hypothetical protein
VPDADIVPIDVHVETRDMNAGQVDIVQPGSYQDQHGIDDADA